MDSMTRPRWVIPLVAATAVLAAGSATALATQVVGHKNPAPAAAGGQAGPAGVTSSASPAGTTTASGGGRASSSGTPADPGKPVRIGTLTLTVPRAWTATRTDRADQIEMCLAAPGTAGCDLTVAAMTKLGPVDVDAFGSMLDREPPGCGGPVHQIVTTAYRTSKLGARPAEYRAYRATCDRTYELEQWTVPTWAPVQVIGSDIRPELLDTVRAVVASAAFSEPDSGRRVGDQGLLTGHSGSGASLHISLDRTIWLSGGADNGHDENSNNSTYDYQVAPSVKISDNGQLCADTFGTNRTCPLSTVLARIDQHRTGVVHLDCNESGVVIAIHGEYRP